MCYAQAPALYYDRLWISYAAHIFIADFCFKDDSQMEGCVIHFLSAAKAVSETLSRLSTPDKVEKLVNLLANEWLETAKEPECTVARQVLELNKQSLLTVDSLYHQRCHLRFAARSRIKQLLSSKTTTQKRKVSQFQSILMPYIHSPFITCLSIFHSTLQLLPPYLSSMS